MPQGSWKTTVAGIAAFLTLNAPEIYDWLMEHQNLDWRKMGFGLCILLLGIFARDKNKTSQDDGLPAKIVQVDDVGNVTNVPTFKDGERAPEVIVTPVGSEVVVQDDGTKILRLPGGK